MEHLYSSKVQVQRNQLTVVDGQAFMDWVNQPATLSALKCRLDLIFIRPGKDQPQAIEAGRAPDRQGVMFVSAKAGLKAGDRIVTVSGPVTGTFDIKVIPDVAVGYARAHHVEVGIVESTQNLVDVFPGINPP